MNLMYIVIGHMYSSYLFFTNVYVCIEFILMFNSIYLILKTNILINYILYAFYIVTYID